METPTVNTEFEQALYKASLREKKSRARAMLAIIAPVVAGCLWLGYSAYEVNDWQSRSRAVLQREADIQQRESAANAKAAKAEAEKTAAEAKAKSAREEESRVKAQIGENKEGLIKMRGEIAGLEGVLNELSTARSRAALLGNSAALESQIMDIRGSLGRGFASMEQHLERALGDTERKPRVYIYISEEGQRETAKQLKIALEAGGFDVPVIAKQAVKKLDGFEIRFFRNPKDKDEAAQLADLVRKQPGTRDPRVSFVADADNAGNGRKYQLWLGKMPAATPVKKEAGKHD